MTTYHHRCTNRNECGARAQLKHKLASGTVRCGQCGNGWVNFDPSVRKQRSKPGYYCTCNAFPFPKHRAGSSPLCEKYIKELTDEDYINYYGRSYA